MNNPQVYHASSKGISYGYGKAVKYDSKYDRLWVKFDNSGPARYIADFTSAYMNGDIVIISDEFQDIFYDSIPQCTEYAILSVNRSSIEAELNDLGYFKCNDKSNDGTYIFYDKNGFDCDKRSITGSKYNINGYDYEGYDINGFDANGYNISGYNAAGFDKEGFNDKGYNRYGYNRLGFDVAGFDRDGYDISGYNIYGYDRAGYDERGYDDEGYDRSGYDCIGYNREGYDRNGYDEYGYDKNGYDCFGYDEDGYDHEGYDEDGYDEYGYDCDGYDEYGYNEAGYDIEGYDEYGYDRDGFDRRGYDSDYIKKKNIVWGDRQLYFAENCHAFKYFTLDHDGYYLRRVSKPYYELDIYSVGTYVPANVSEKKLALFSQTDINISNLLFKAKKENVNYKRLQYFFNRTMRMALETLLKQKNITGDVHLIAIPSSHTIENSEYPSFSRVFINEMCDYIYAPDVTFFNACDNLIRSYDIEAQHTNTHWNLEDQLNSLEYLDYAFEEDTYILIDDIVTTGTVMQACRQLLIESDALDNNIYCLTLLATRDRTKADWNPFDEEF